MKSYYVYQFMMALHGCHISKFPKKIQYTMIYESERSKLKAAHSINYFPRFLGKNIKNCPPSKVFLFTYLISVGLYIYTNLHPPYTHFPEHCRAHDIRNIATATLLTCYLFCEHNFLDRGQKLLDQRQSNTPRFRYIIHEDVCQATPKKKSAFGTICGFINFLIMHNQYFLGNRKPNKNWVT